MLEKLKSLILNDQVFYSLLIIMVAIISFWLGRLSLLTETTLVEPSVNRVEVKQTELNQKESFSDNNQDTKPPTTKLNNDFSEVGEAKVVGSRSGTKYHLTTCPGAKQIKPENLINFSSVAAAEAAGYKPAANCPELQ